MLYCSHAKPTHKFAEVGFSGGSELDAARPSCGKPNTPWRFALGASYAWKSAVVRSDIVGMHWFYRLEPAVMRDDEYPRPLSVLFLSMTIITLNALLNRRLCQRNQCVCLRDAKQDTHLCLTDTPQLISIGELWSIG